MPPSSDTQPGFLHLLRNVLRQAWPVLVTSWASLAFSIMDTAMVGHASAVDLQIMALAGSIYITVFVGLMGVVHALIPIIAQHFGAGQLTEVGRAWGQGMWMALGLSAVGATAMLLPDIWLSWSGDIAPEVRSGIAWYLRALVLALPAMLMFRTIYALGTAVSRPRTVMTINLATVGVKALLNWLLIFGKLGLPALGAAGAGLSTALVGWLSLAVGLWALRRQPHFRAFQPRLGRPRWADQRALLRLGLPMGASYLIEVCAFSFMALLIAREGMLVSGAHQITSNLAALCYMMPMAIGIASASLTAQAIGAGDPALARRTGRAGITLVLGGALLTLLTLTSAREFIVGAYTNDPQVAAIALSLVLILPWFHLCDALQCINSYLLRAYKVAVVPTLLQAVALTGVGLTGGWWVGFGPAAGALEPLLSPYLPGVPLGAASMWTMSALGLGLSATLLFAWYGRVLRAHAGRG